MSRYELIDVANGFSSRIDIQWTLFITFHLALFGGIVYVNRPLRLPEKIAALIIYSGFATLNLAIMRGMQLNLERTFTDIARFTGDPCCSDSALISHMADSLATGRFDTAIAVIWIIHVVMFVLVFLSIVFDRAISSPAKAQS